MKKILFAGLFLVVAAAAPAADTSLLPNPLKDAKAGQWVSYKVMIMGVEAEQKQSIAKVTGEGDDRVFTMKVEILVDGTVMQSEETDLSYRDAVAEQLSAFDDQEADIQPTEVEIKGEVVKGVVVAFTQEDMNCKLFLSEYVPVAGIVKMEVEGLDEPVMELADFGG